MVFENNHGVSIALAVAVQERFHETIVIFKKMTDR